MVSFSINIFTPEFKEEIKGKNRKAFGADADEEVEVGSVKCLNLIRPPIYVYNWEEAVDLIEVGYEVASEQNRQKSYPDEEFPKQFVKKVKVEVEKPFVGRLYPENNKRSVSFKSKEELLTLLKQC